MVEIRGVEPLTFSMPLLADGLTGQDHMRQTRIFIDSADMPDCDPSVTMCLCCNFVVKPRRHPPTGNQIMAPDAGTSRQHASCQISCPVFCPHIAAARFL